jgi:hypothetical protein
MLPPGLMQGPTQGRPRSEQERRLLRAFRALDGASQQTLLAFAEFLQQRDADAGTAGADAGDALAEPVLAPRPAQESVVGAIKRLRRSYPMLDGGTMLQETSALMAAHVLQGREASAVVDDLEALFAQRYAELKSKS